MVSKPVLAAVLGIGQAAGARTVDQRHADQQTRIDDGRPTGGGAARDERQQAAIDVREARMRARDGGRLDAYRLGGLQQREDDAGRHIRDSTHDGRGR